MQAKMPSLKFPHFSLPTTWFQNLIGSANSEVEMRNRNHEIPDISSSNDDEGSSSSIGRINNPIECYACTQVGVPVFHSIRCDRAHQPAWDASAGSSLFPVARLRAGKHGSSRPSGLLGPILDPRSEQVRRWNRAILIARGVALAVDPVFFYVLSIGRGGSCLYMDGVLAVVVTAIRTCVDVVHLRHVWLQFRLAYVSRESLVVGCGKLVWDARAIATHYVRSLEGFWFDLYVILPIPQVIFWTLVPRLLREDKIQFLMTILVLIFLFQFLPKVHHSISLMRRMQKVTGYVFGTIWWGFGLNLIAYFIASHVVGGCWYVFAIQRVAACLSQHCNGNEKCNLSLSCSKEICYQLLKQGDLTGRCDTDTVKARKSFCLDPQSTFAYGIYGDALPVLSSNAILIKILYPISWGLFQLR